MAPSRDLFRKAEYSESEEIYSFRVRVFVTNIIIMQKSGEIYNNESTKLHKDLGGSENLEWNGSTN